MNRRSFFSAICGAAGGAAAKDARTNSGAVRASLYSGVECPACGQVLLVRADDSPKGKGKLQYLTCITPGCARFGWKYARPTVELETAPGWIVRRVDRAQEEERRREREWHRREHARLGPAAEGGYRDPKAGAVRIYKTRALGPTTDTIFRIGGGPIIGQ